MAVATEKKTRTAVKRKKSKLARFLNIAIIILSVYIVVLCAAAVVIDKRHAEIELNGDENVVLEYGAQYVDAGALGFSRGRVFGEWSRHAPVVTVSGAPDTGKLGDYEVHYTATVFGRDAERVRHISVVDTTPPVIELGHKPGYSASWLDGYSEEGYTATDNVDGDITASVVREEKDGRIVYTVTDSSGNTATAERPISSLIAAPILTLNGEADMYVCASQSFTDPGCTASDTAGSDLTQYVVTEGEVIPWVPGSYQLTYSITNQRGDSASVNRTVNVYAADRPAVSKPTEKTIFLTFDDGPSCYTEELLDVLDKYNVKATFFVTNLDTHYVNMIGEAYRRGHTIGAHSYCHDYYTVYAGEQEYFNDFNRMQEIIRQQTGSYTRLMRFPGGSSNTVSRFNPGIMSRLTQAFNDMGYRYFDWNVSSGDAGETTETERVIKNVIEGCEEHTLCVVLQHDCKDYSVAAVEEIILWGLENGYTFSGLSMTSYEAHHGVAN